MTAILRESRNLLFALGVILLLLGASVVVVPETRQLVVMREGAAVRVVNRFVPGAAPGSGGAGLLLHIPLVEQLVWAERGLQALTAQRQQVRTVDGQLLDLDIELRYRVYDPVRMATTQGSEDRLDSQLSAALPGLLAAELAKLDARQVMLPGAGSALGRVRAELDAKARESGAQVVDLRIARAGLSDQARQEVLTRMQEERERMVSGIEADGVREAQLITAAAQAEAARILGESAGRDPEFYRFYRAMRSYDTILADPEAKNRTTIVLGPGSGYLKYFRSE